MAQTAKLSEKLYTQFVQVVTNRHFLEVKPMCSPKGVSGQTHVVSI